MNDRQLTTHFKLFEFLQSDTATRRNISNAPAPAALLAIERQLAPGMQRIRDLLGAPISVSSGYRSPALNVAIGGSKSSQHSRGEAADFRAPGFGTPLDICRAIVANKDRIGFDQLIEEGTWVHVSFVATQPRGQVLTAHFEGGRARYSTGLRA